MYIERIETGIFFWGSTHQSQAIPRWNWCRL